MAQVGSVPRRRAYQSGHRMHQPTSQNHPRFGSELCEVVGQSRSIPRKSTCPGHGLTSDGPATLLRALTSRHSGTGERCPGPRRVEAEHVTRRRRRRRLARCAAGPSERGAGPRHRAVARAGLLGDDPLRRTHGDVHQRDADRGRRDQIHDPWAGLREVQCAGASWSVRRGAGWSVESSDMAPERSTLHASRSTTEGSAWTVGGACDASWRRWDGRMRSPLRGSGRLDQTHRLFHHRRSAPQASRDKGLDLVGRDPCVTAGNLDCIELAPGDQALDRLRRLAEPSAGLGNRHELDLWRGHGNTPWAHRPPSPPCNSRRGTLGGLGLYLQNTIGFRWFDRIPWVWWVCDPPYRPDPPSTRWYAAVFLKFFEGGATENPPLPPPTPPHGGLTRGEEFRGRSSALFRGGDPPGADSTWRTGTSPAPPASQRGERGNGATQYRSNSVHISYIYLHRGML